MAMHRETGKEIATLREEVEQSIDGILGTVPGDRVMRGSYGSRLFELTDAPLNASGKAQVAQAIGEAIGMQEKRVKLTRVTYEITGPGSVEATMLGEVRQTGQQITRRRALR